MTNALLELAVILRKGEPTLTDVHSDRPLGSTSVADGSLCPNCGRSLKGPYDSGQPANCPYCGAGLPNTNMVGVPAVPFAKMNEELRYTYSPVFQPLRVDAHGDWTTAEVLQKACWDLMRSGNRDITLQHIKELVVGECVELNTWPYEHQADFHVPGDDINKASGRLTLPAGTMWMGVVWEPAAWSLIKQGKLRSLSMEGVGRGLEADLPMAA